MNKKLTSFVLAGLILGSVPQTQCNRTIEKCKKIVVAASAVAFGATLFRYFSKKTESTPEVRFDKKKLQEAIENKDKKEFINQIWYFIDDIIIGQQYKKSGVKANKEGKLEVSKGCPSTGVIGTIHSKLHPIGKVVLFFKVTSDLLKKWEEGLDYWSYHLGQ